MTTLGIKAKISIVALAIVSIAVFVIYTGIARSKAQNEPLDAQQEQLGITSPDSSWVNVGKFDGYQTKAEPSKISDGANSTGQNTEINDGDRISIRKMGTEVIGTASTEEFPVLSLHTFRRRDGENLMMRNASDTLQYFDEVADTWETINDGYTIGQKFAYADYNINTDLRSYVYFGNGVQSYSRWTGAHTNLTLAATSTATTLFVGDTTGFNATGTLVYCGVELVYSAKTDTTFTVSPAHVCAASRGVTQAVEEFATAPKGNIMLNANNRIFVAGIASTSQAVYFSKYGDATNFVSANLVTTSTADSAGIFNLGEGGGAVTGLALDEGSVYILKKAIIYKATLAADFLYSIVPLKAFDGKSQTTGAISDSSVFTGSNGLFFVTPDRQVMNLARLEGYDYPQISPISEPIKPTIEASEFSSSTGIFWRNRAFFAAKGPSSDNNNVVFIYNSRIGAWESPIIGWNPSAWTIYDDGTGEQLYFADALSTNVYRVTDTPLDNGLGVTANYRTKRFDFGLPYALKEFDNVYIDGYIQPNTSLTISLLLDYNGYTQTYTTTLRGTETGYLFDAQPFNLFGFHPFGYVQFGSEANSDSKRFRVYLNKNLRRVPFYDAQLEFASDGENQAWEITNYAFRVRESTQPEKGSLYRAW